MTMLPFFDWRRRLQTWEYERLDAAQVENETDCYELEPMYEVRVGTGVQLLSMVRSPNPSEPTTWFAQVTLVSRFRNITTIDVATSEDFRCGGALLSLQMVITFLDI